MHAGASIPSETMMHFPPCFRFPPYFRKIFGLWGKFLQILPFPEKFLDFHPPKFLMTFFLVIDHKFRIPPYFPWFNTFPLCFAKTIISIPTLTKFPPVLDKFTCFLYTLRAFHFPPALTMMHLCITQCTYWMPLFKPKWTEHFGIQRFSETGQNSEETHDFTNW